MHQNVSNKRGLATLQIGHRLTGSAHATHMAVCPHGWKVISHGPSQREQLGLVTESTLLSVVLVSRGLVADLEGVACFFANETLSLGCASFPCKTPSIRKP